MDLKTKPNDTLFPLSHVLLVSFRPPLTIFTPFLSLFFPSLSYSLSFPSLLFPVTFLHGREGGREKLADVLLLPSTKLNVSKSWLSAW